MPSLLSRSLPILAVALIAVPLDAQRDRERPRGPEKMENFEFTMDSFRSEALGKSMRYGIYLPKGYDDEKNKDKRYPLVIWLHGMFEDHRRFHDRGGAEVLDKLAGEGAIPELVLVTANGGRSSFYTNGVTSGKWEDAISIDLPEHIDETYRVEKSRHKRAIVGVSMGGYGALKIAFKNPQLFGVVAAHSAAVMPRDPGELEDRFPWLKRFGGSRRALGGIFGDPIDREKWDAENLLNIGDELDAKTLGGLKVYMDCGDQDRYGFEGPNTELHELLKKKKIKHTWELVKGGNHGWRSGYNQAAIPRSLAFVTAAWAAGKGASGLRGLLGNPDPGKGNDR